MQARRALLKKLASVTTWNSAGRDAFAGETCVETRNTIYRFRDGVCFAVTTRNEKKKPRTNALVGMRIVGWLSGVEPLARVSFAWEAGAYAVLWRPATIGNDDEAMAMTSPTTSFTRGIAPEQLQAVHDEAPPSDSQMYRRAPSMGRLRTPSRSSISR